MNVRDHRGGDMKIILALVAASGLSLAIASQVSAAPAGGAAIAGSAQQIDPAISVAAKKKSTAAKPPCAVDQTRSNRTGNCRPLTSEEK
jgi:hypothetical protein